METLKKIIINYLLGVIIVGLVFGVNGVIADTEDNSASNTNDSDKKIVNLNEEDIQKEIMLKAYPIGSIYVSSTPTDPGTLFGGTWARFGNGSVLVGADETASGYETAEKTGGALSHTIAASNLPVHNHSIPAIGATVSSEGSHAHTVANAGSHTHTVANAGSHTHTVANAGSHTHTVASAGSHAHTVANAGSHTHTVASAGSHTHGVASAGSHAHKFTYSYAWGFNGNFSMEVIGKISGTGSKTAQLKTGTDQGTMTQTASFANHNHTLDSQGSHTHGIAAAGSHTHTLTAAGSHTHTLTAAGSHTHTLTAAGSHTHTLTAAGSHTHTVTAAGSHTHTVTTSASNTNGCPDCKGDALDTRDKFITVYMWKRIA